jgi:tetratricopeptide (TPR) repeat protein
MAGPERRSGSVGRPGAAPVPLFFAPRFPAFALLLFPLLLFPLLVAILVLPGCGTSPPAPSRVDREAQAAGERGARAFQAGNLAGARALYEQALKRDVSIENAEGIAADLLSLARIEQAAGNSAAAHALLDKLLSDSPLALPPARHAQAAARKAQLYLAERDVQRAAEWGERATALCVRSACSALAATLNLRALAAFHAGEADAALRFARQAIAAAPDDEGRGERANGHRLSGEAHLAINDGSAALPALREALALDQALGLPRRIFRDLVLLGDAQEKLGQRDEARAYYARALAVGAAEGDGALQEQAKARLDASQPPR